MQNNNNNRINFLKYLKNKSCLNDKFCLDEKWQNVNYNYLYKSFNIDENVKKIRFIFKAKSTPTIFINHLLNIWDENNTWLFSTPIKFFALIEQHFFDGEKIRFDSIIGGWIIPINISFFLSQIKNFRICIQQLCTCSTNNLPICQCFTDIETINLQILKNNNNHDNQVKIYIEHIASEKDFRIYFHQTILFAIIWVDDFESFSYCKFNILNTNGDYNEIIYKKQNLKLVEIYDKKAIIIPTCVDSFSDLKYLFKNIVYTTKDLTNLLYTTLDLLNLETHTDKVSFIEIYFTNNNNLKMLVERNIVYTRDNY